MNARPAANSTTTVTNGQTLWTVAIKVPGRGGQPDTYIHGNVIYTTKDAARAARNQQGGRRSGLKICRFYVNQVAQRTFPVTIQVPAASAAEAQEKANRVTATW